MQPPEIRLQELGLSLPKLPAPVGNFAPFVLHKNLLFLSGQGPLHEDGSLATGKVGAEISIEQAEKNQRPKLTPINGILKKQLIMMPQNMSFSSKTVICMECLFVRVYRYLLKH